MNTIDEEIEEVLDLKIDEVKNLKEEYGSQPGGGSRKNTEEDAHD